MYCAKKDILKNPIFLLLIYILFTQLGAQTDSDSTHSESNYYILPIIYHSPETKLALGAMLQYNFREENSSSESRSSFLRPILIFTQKKQIISQLNYQIYFNDEKYFLSGGTGYLLFPNTFWGVGNDTPDENEEQYSMAGFFSSNSLLLKISKNIHAGLRYDFSNFTTSKRDTLLQLEETTGRKGGIISGGGPVIQYDTRDKIHWPSKGYFNSASLLLYHSILGSKFDFTVINIDLRKYISLFKTHVLAFQYFSNFISGNPPFYSMSNIGGSRFLRGYYEGRYRDKSIIMTQAEYRTPSWYNIGLVAFSGYGEVAPALNKFILNDFKYSFGFGLRYMIDPKEKLNLRFDFGFVESGMNFYVEFAEAF